MAKKNFFEKLIRSLGFKRKLSSYLAALLEPLRLIPGLGGLIAGTELVSGGLGAVGLAHATTSGEIVKDKKLVSVGALLATVIALSHWMPELASLIPLLQKLAALAGGAALGVSLASKGKDEE